MLETGPLPAAIVAVNAVGTEALPQSVPGLPGMVAVGLAFTNCVIEVVAGTGVAQLNEEYMSTLMI